MSLVLKWVHVAKSDLICFSTLIYSLLRIFLSSLIWQDFFSYGFCDYSTPGVAAELEHHLIKRPVRSRWWSECFIGLL